MTWEQAFTGISVLSAAAAAYWGYRRGKRSDQVSEQSGIATETRAGTQQIIDGLNALVDQYQESAATHRDTVHYLEGRLAQVLEENENLKLELVALRKKYGD